jgi:hypothetical protein
MRGQERGTGSSLSGTPRKRGQILLQGFFFGALYTHRLILEFHSSQKRLYLSAGVCECESDAGFRIAGSGDVYK